MSNKKVRKGVVTSDKMEKTVVVRVKRVFSHPLFGKSISVYKKFKAHDEENKCKIGDVVVIKETRPTSKGKRWNVVEITGFEKVTAKQYPGRLHKKVIEQKAEGSEQGEAVNSDTGSN